MRTQPPLLISALTSFLYLTIATPSLLDPMTSLIGQALQVIPLLSQPVPPALMTKNPSPECANVNEGALLCCQSSFNGDIPLIVEVAPAFAYKLNPNSINCIYGQRNFTDCSRGVELCCQVNALTSGPLQDLVSLALYCNSPSQVESPPWAPTSTQTFSLLPSGR